jgi:hypothetical protein
MQEGSSPQDQCPARLTRGTVAWLYHPFFQTFGGLLALIGAAYWLSPQIPPEAWAQLSVRGLAAGAALGGLLSLPWLRYWLKRLPALNHAAHQNPVFFLERNPQTMPREGREVQRAGAYLILAMVGSLLLVGKGLLHLPTATGGERLLGRAGRLAVGLDGGTLDLVVALAVGVRSPSCASVVCASARLLSPADHRQLSRSLRLKGRSHRTGVAAHRAGCATPSDTPPD